MISDYFNENCTRKRAVQSLGERNRPTTTYDTKDYPCRVVRKTTAVYIPGNPQYAVSMQTRAYMNADADVKLGDLLICGDFTYHVIYVYKPNNHHLEADLQLDKQEI